MYENNEFINIINCLLRPESFNNPSHNLNKEVY